MASFLLIHGSGQNATCWERVGRILTSRGHEVSAPDLPKYAPELGLEDHAAAIARKIFDPRTIVVAHSFCGALLPLVPHFAECGRLAFLAAVIPEPGRSVRDQFAADPAMFRPEWIEAGKRWFDPAQSESLSREFLFHDCDEETLAWALSTVETFDTRNLVTQPSPFTRWPDVPTAAIVATEDRTLDPAWFRSASRRLLGKEAIEVGSGHCPQVSRPEEIAEILGRFAS